MAAYLDKLQQPTDSLPCPRRPFFWGRATVGGRGMSELLRSLPGTIRNEPGFWRLTGRLNGVALDYQAEDGTVAAN